MRRGRLLVGGLLLLPSLTAAWAFSPRPVLADDVTTTITTAGETAYVIPAGAYALQVTVVGSAGGDSAGSALPGQGAEVQATIPVPDGVSTLYLEVGSSTGVGGGGASVGGGAGGGASDIQTCSASDPGCAYTADPASDPRLVVAGGGGGGGQSDPYYDWRQGGGGGSAGSFGAAVTGPGAGGDGSDPYNGAPGGGAGLGIDGSAAAPGAGCLGDGTGTAGSPGAGGAGQELPVTAGWQFAAGGSGGGGWVGGSGGGSGGCYFPSIPDYLLGGGGGGGAGASHIESSATGVSVTTAGDTPAEVVITPVPMTAPSVTSAASTTFTVGSYGTFTVTGSGGPAPSLSDGGARLPAGVSFTDNSDGTATLAGTPQAGSGGVYDFTITAGNGISPDSTQDFTLTVDEAPAITSADHTVFVFGVFGSFNVTTSGYPDAGLSINPCLPGWITFTDNGNGTATISGTPLGTGAAECVLTASNGVSPDATQDFTFYAGAAPAITSLDFTGFVAGRPDTFTVTTQSVPVASVSDNGATLPSGVTFTDNGDGTAILTGTPATGTDGTYDFTITASNGISPDATEDFTLTVADAAAPAITSDDGATFTVGGSGSFTVTSSGFPDASISDDGATLPDGVSLTDDGDGTATLAGTPAAGTVGDYELTFTASNGTSPDAAQDFTLTVDAASTTVSLASSANPAVVGEAVTLTATVVVTPSSPVTPTGTVGFFEGTAPLSGCADQPVADDGTATCTLSFAAAGDLDTVAVYAGNASFVRSASNDLDQAVGQSATTVTVTSSPDPATVGQAVTITVTVQAVAPGGGDPTGSVTVDVDGTPFATLTLDSSVDSQAVLTTNALAAGSHSITASYAGDTNYSASATSEADTQPVTSTPPVPLTGGATGPGLGVVPGMLLILAGLGVLAWRRRTVTS